MSKRKRTVIAIVVLELLLAAGWFWMHNVAITSPNTTPDSTRVIGEVFGAAMGIVLAISPLLCLLARKNDLGKP